MIDGPLLARYCSQRVRIKFTKTVPQKIEVLSGINVPNEIFIIRGYLIDELVIGPLLFAKISN